MVLFNHATREMTAKIVYYGPGLCGKTTNLMVIFDKLDPKSRGKMLSLATKTDRTLFFDLLPVDIGKVGAFNLKIQLYTVPGQVFYNETRKLVLKGADAVVFVVDSQPTMVESNRESFANLIENLEATDIDVNDLPIIIQYNKRDIPGVLSVEDLEEQLGFDGYPSAEASAIRGEGVMETFKLASKVTAKHLISRLQGKNAPARDGKAAAKKPKKAAVQAAEPPAPAASSPEPLLSAQPTSNPFSASFGGENDQLAAPFAAEPGADYEKVEEVSLDQLLEGRDRPATIAGGEPIPVSLDDEVEHMDAGALLPADSGSKHDRSRGGGAASNGDLRKEMDSLRAEIAALRSDYTQLREALKKGVGELSKIIR
ncbi:MAG TPA: GTPase domain-containing protein [Thermoanaerobaculia bacterium]|nr:GTPase domain-containing protein [Thermoanaerobaculia bacterium]